MFVTPLQSEVEKNPSRSWLITIDSKPREQPRASGLWAKRIYPIRKDGNLLLCNLDWSFLGPPGPSETAYRLTVSLWSVGILVRYGGICMISYFLHTVYSVYVVTTFGAQTFWQKRSYTTSAITSRHWLYSQEHVMGFEYIQSLISKRYPIYTQRSSNNPHV